MWFGAGQFFLAPQPILVGVLHSQTGPIAVSEQAMIDAERLAFEEINAAVHCNSILITKITMHISHNATLSNSILNAKTSPARTAWHNRGRT